jgi:anti-anti-sigma factor
MSVPCQKTVGALHLVAGNGSPLADEDEIFIRLCGVNGLFEVEEAKGVLDAKTLSGKQTVISLSIVGEMAHLKIRGRVVHGVGSADAVTHAIRFCAASHFRLLVMNLRDVDLMDAAGLSTLVFAYCTAQALGARFKLAYVPPRIRHLLAVTRLDTIFVASEWTSVSCHQ